MTGSNSQQKNKCNELDRQAVDIERYIVNR